MPQPEAVDFGDDVATYPAQQDHEVRQAAIRVDYPAVIDTLNDIRNELLGDYVRVAELANHWGQSGVMRLPREDIANAKINVAQYWAGSAHRGFDGWSGDIVGMLDRNELTMGNISIVLGEMGEEVVKTYADAIEFIGKCAGNLVGLGGYAALASGTSWIPGVNVLTTEALVTKIIDALSTFVIDVSGLIADSTERVGAYKTDGDALVVRANQFKAPVGLPREVGHPRSWNVVPVT